MRRFSETFIISSSGSNPEGKYFQGIELTFARNGVCTGGFLIDWQKMYDNGRGITGERKLVKVLSAEEVYSSTPDKLKSNLLEYAVVLNRHSQKQLAVKDGKDYEVYPLVFAGGLVVGYRVFQHLFLGITRFAEDVTIQQLNEKYDLL